MKETDKKKINLLLLIATAVVSALVWLPVNLLYQLLIGSVNRPVAIGVAFALMLLAVSLVCWLISTLSMTFKGDVITGDRTSAKIPLYIVGFALICALLGCGLELLYEIEIKQDYNAPEGYIFVVDDSGSTTSTDPKGLRYKAIESLLETKADTYPYMVYGFADNVVVEQGMSVVGDGIPELNGRYEGGTCIREALETVIDDYNNGVWTAQTVPTVILITDGYASDIGFFRPANGVLREYAKAGVPISTVGFSNADKNLLSSIATKTGGVFVDISNADALDEAVEAATALSEDDRTLLSDRLQGDLNGLLAAMRILFVVILAMAISFSATVGYGRNDEGRFMMLCGLAKGILAAVLLEVGICVLGLPELIVDWIAMVLIGTVIARMPVVEKVESQSNDEGYRKKSKDYGEQRFRI